MSSLWSQSSGSGSSSDVVGGEGIKEILLLLSGRAEYISITPRNVSLASGGGQAAGKIQSPACVCSHGVNLPNMWGTSMMAVVVKPRRPRFSWGVLGNNVKWTLSV